MEFQLRRFSGCVMIAVGVLAIVLIGFFNPTAKPMNLAFEYSGIYLASICLVAVGLWAVTDE